jgi:hypothetical protein
MYCTMHKRLGLGLKRNKEVELVKKRKEEGRIQKINLKTIK